VAERRGSGEERAPLADRLRWRAASDAELVAGVRGGRLEALREFYARFEPLLARFAARAGLRSDQWEEQASDALCDVVRALLANDRRTDVRSIHGYIVRAFHNRVLDATRGERRREIRREAASEGASGDDEPAVLAACSEDSVRASRGAGWEPSSPSRALGRLAALLDDELSEPERLMLVWVSNAVPMREIARWQGVSYVAAKVRLSRLRSRLRERALRHVSECTGVERAELVGFFRRGAEVAESAARGRARRVREPGGANGDD
jgi:RNA polymerase sigma factor (sigma-70 family)